MGAGAVGGEQDASRVVAEVAEPGSLHTAAVARAAARAAAQLFAVSVVIEAIVGNVLALLAFVVVMFAVAARTAGHRITPGAGWWWAGLPIATGVLPVLLALMAAGLLPLQGLTLIPVAGNPHRRSAHRHRVGRAARARRDDSTMQTRTVGLVTLPGAFVGVLLGGGSALDAGPIQLFILVALLAVEGVAIAVTLELFVRGRLQRPSEAVEVSSRSTSRVAGDRRVLSRPRWRFGRPGARFYQPGPSARLGGCGWLQHREAAIGNVNGFRSTRGPRRSPRR